MTLKSREFERGITSTDYIDIKTDTAANINYVFNGDSEALLNDLDVIKTFIDHHHTHQKPRLKLLKSYYEGQNITILSKNRRKEVDNADHRASHPFAEYISNFVNGYFLGKGIIVENEAAKDEINAVHIYNDIDSLNRELGLDLSIYGRAYELAMKNKEDEYRFYRMRPEDTFLIYDDTVEQNSIAAVYYRPVDVMLNQDTEYLVNVYTENADHSYNYELSSSGDLKAARGPSQHAYTRVPITEYINNRDRRGDFEKAIPQIDLYDAAQSDTANYMTDLNDALLVITGNLGLDADEAKKQKEANILFIDPAEYEDASGNKREGKADAKYIFKQYDVNGSESYKDRLENDIHLLTNTPNLNDSAFSGTQSGESMKYKLFGLEQNAVIKEGMFKKGLRRRYKLLQTIMRTDKALPADIDLESTTYRFNRNLPQSLTEDLKTYVGAGGQLSKKTLLDMFGFVSNTDEELDRINAESNESPEEATDTD